MAVTKAVYESIVTGSNEGAVALAGIFRQAFIDAGLMSEWHDAWSVANTRSGNTYFKVLKLTQDSGKTYGTTYVLFTFFADIAATVDGLKAYISFSTGWNATTHVPTGTQYVDYYAAPSTSYGYDGNATLIYDNSPSSQEFSLVRYTSGNTSIFTCPTAQVPSFVIQSSLATQPSWVDLDKACIPPFFCISPQASPYSSGWRGINFYWPCQIRRMVFPGRSASGTTNTYFKAVIPTSGYIYTGATSVDNNNDPASNANDWLGAIHLPWSEGDLIKAASSSWCPLVKDIDMALPLNMKLPSDFCIATIPSATRKGSSLGQVSISEAEVWEIVTLASTPNTSNSLVLMARVV